MSTHYNLLFIDQDHLCGVYSITYDCLLTQILVYILACISLSVVPFSFSQLPSRILCSLSPYLQLQLHYADVGQEYLATKVIKYHWLVFGLPNYILGSFIFLVSSLCALPSLEGCSSGNRMCCVIFIATCCICSFCPNTSKTDECLSKFSCQQEVNSYFCRLQTLLQMAKAVQLHNMLLFIHYTFRCQPEYR